MVNKILCLVKNFFDYELNNSKDAIQQNYCKYYQRELFRTPLFLDFDLLL